MDQRVQFNRIVQLPRSSKVRWDEETLAFLRLVEKYNPNHRPAGNPDGGQFAPKAISGAAIAAAHEGLKKLPRPTEKDYEDYFGGWDREYRQLKVPPFKLAQHPDDVDWYAEGKPRLLELHNAAGRNDNLRHPEVRAVRAPVQYVELDTLHHTQPGVYPKIVTHFIENHTVRGASGPMVHRIDGKHYIIDGHHRLTADKLLGRTRSKVSYVNWDAGLAALDAGASVPDAVKAAYGIVKKAVAAPFYDKETLFYLALGYRVEKFNPNHHPAGSPGGTGGQFAPKQGMSDYAIAAADTIRGNAIEHAYLFAADGTAILENYTSGHWDHVSLGEGFDNRKLKNATFVHNHPNNRGFSRKDVTFPAEHDMQQMVAATKNGDYVITRPSGGWLAPAVYSAAYSKVELRLVTAGRDLLQQTAQKHGVNSKQWFDLRERLENEFSHKLWQAVFAELGEHDYQFIPQVKKYNPNHYSAGTPGGKGGQFAPKPGGTATVELPTSMTSEVARNAELYFGYREGAHHFGEAIAKCFPADTSPQVKVSSFGTTLTVMVTAGGKTSGSSITRSFKQVRGKLIAYHEDFELDAELQGQGIAKDIMRKSLNFYQQAGVDRIELIANIDVGGYAWARQGYVPSRMTWESVGKRAVSKAREIEAVHRMRRDRGKEPLHPVPDDFAAKVQAIVDGPPENIWKLADLRHGSENVGKRLLLGSTWEGTLNMGNSAAMERTMRYLD